MYGRRAGLGWRTKPRRVTGNDAMMDPLLDANHGQLLVVVTGRPGGWLPGAWPVKCLTWRR